MGVSAPASKVVGGPEVNAEELTGFHKVDCCDLELCIMDQEARRNFLDL